MVLVDDEGGGLSCFLETDMDDDDNDPYDEVREVVVPDAVRKEEEGFCCVEDDVRAVGLVPAPARGNGRRFRFHGAALPLLPPLPPLEDVSGAEVTPLDDAVIPLDGLVVDKARPTLPPLPPLDIPFPPPPNFLSRWRAGAEAAASAAVGRGGGPVPSKKDARDGGGG